MSEDITRQFDASTSTGITVHRGDSIHFFTNLAAPNVAVHFTGNSPFADGSKDFNVNNQGPTKQVSGSAVQTGYPMTLTPSGGTQQSGSVTVDAPQADMIEPKKL